MDIRHRFNQVKTFTLSVVGFAKNHKRLSLAVAAALLIAGPLLTKTGGEGFFLNLIGLGIAALVVLRIMRANDRRKAAKARPANCRCNCHRQQRRNPHQQGTQQTQQQGGTT